MSFDPLNTIDDPAYVEHLMANMPPDLPRDATEEEPAQRTYEPHEVPEGPKRGDTVEPCPEGTHGEYSVLANSEDYVAHVIEDVFMASVVQAGEDARAEEAEHYDASNHPWAQFERPREGTPKAPEFVVDNVIRAGNSVLSGNRGVGKTSLLVPLLFGIADLIRYPLPITIKRKVVLITEDSEQIWDVVEAMRQAGVLTASNDEIFEHFKVVNSVRLKPSEIVKVSSAYAGMQLANRRKDGSTFWASPLIVMDTISSNIDLDNISDNSEVARAVALIRERFRGMSTLMVGHMAKAMSRVEAKDPSTIGAQAFEADTQGCLYVIKEGDDVYLTLGKERFNPVIREYAIDSFTETFEAEGPLGDAVSVIGRYNLLKPLAAGEKDERKAEAKAKVDAEKLDRVKAKVCRYLAGQDEPRTGRDVKKAVGGNAGTVGEALVELYEDGVVDRSDGPNRSQLFKLSGDSDEVLESLGITWNH